MNRRQQLLLRQRERRLKHIGFTILLVIVVGACGKATLSRSPDDIEEPDSSLTEEESVGMVTTRAGIVKPTDTSLYPEGSHYLEREDGEFDVLLISDAVVLDEYVDQMVEVTGTLRSVRGDNSAKIMEVQSLSSASAKINGDAVDAVKRLADPSYGFTDTDTYTLTSSSASAGTAVVKVEKGTRVFHVKLVKKPDPLTGEWEIYEIREGGAGFEADTDTTVVPETETTTPPNANGLKEPVTAKEGYKTYTDNLAGFSIQYPAGWFFWAAGEAQTAESKPVSSRVLFSDVKVEYTNVLIGLDIAPVGFQQTLTSYYLNPSTETATTVRGVKATKRTYDSGHVRVFVPRDDSTTFIISAIPRDGSTKTDVLASMLETLLKTM